MAGKRSYKVKGTRDFIVLAGIFFFLCVWAIFDAWFPTKGVIKKHPRSVDVVCTQSGVMKSLNVSVGSTVIPEKDGKTATLIAELKSTELDAELEKAKGEYAVLRKLANNGDVEARAKADAVAAKMSDILSKIDGKKIFTPLLGNEKDGVITEVLVDKYSYVEAGQPIAVITPNSHFYVFNKSLAIFSFIAFWVFLVIHIFAH